MVFLWHIKLTNTGDARMRIYIYTRTSTAQQNDGLAAQEATCRSFMNNLAQQDQWRCEFQPCMATSGVLTSYVVREQISGCVHFANRHAGCVLLAKRHTGLYPGNVNVHRDYESARHCDKPLAVLRALGVSTSVCH